MGQRYDRGWDYLEDRKYTDEQLHDQHVGAFMYAHQPRSVCVHASYGPYGGKNVHLVTTESDTDLYIVTRHQYDLDLVCPQIICGALNRWIVYPGCITDTLVDREDEKRGTEFMEQLVLSTTQLYCVESDTPSLRTKLDIYGHAMTGLAMSHLLRKDDIWGDAIEEARTMDDGDRKILEKLCGRVASLHTKFQVEEEGLNDWMSDTLAGLPYQVWDPWLDKIKLRCWRDVPACECCGWTTEAYCEEFDEGLSFIEATHKVMQAMGAIE